MIRLESLGPPHAEEILAGQDESLAREIIGRRWEREQLEEFLGRCASWRKDGPVQELAAFEGDAGRMVGGGGVNRLAPGLARDQVALTYWLLERARGRGFGIPLASAVVERARSVTGAREAVLLISPDNTASQSVARALGARPTGEQVRHPADGTRQAERWLLDLQRSVP
ncbi:GNAT family N-acetyltransferase [Brachybacterium sp. EE-P12]|uniref:GNAT family N-acetyltransferase n=1 Tax=Brachybacterium sp. EE-P12 TaxID=2306299 RepID=UPI000F08970D|nr:GNAT family N-acetyltransferase [Brachybacterium sp. EE-P12]